MGDMGDTFRENREVMKGVKKQRMAARLEYMKKNKWNFEEKANGHVRIVAGDDSYDAWLTTGKWTRTGSNVFNRGWKHLVRNVERSMRP